MICVGLRLFRGTQNKAIKYLKGFICATNVDSLRRIPWVGFLTGLLLFYLKRRKVSISTLNLKEGLRWTRDIDMTGWSIKFSRNCANAIQGVFINLPLKDATIALSRLRPISLSIPPSLSFFLLNRRPLSDRWDNDWNKYWFSYSEMKKRKMLEKEKVFPSISSI